MNQHVSYDKNVNEMKLFNYKTKPIKFEAVFSAGSRKVVFTFYSYAFIYKKTSLYPAGKIAEKAMWRSVFLTILHRILNADSTKTPSSSITF